MESDPSFISWQRSSEADSASWVATKWVELKLSRGSFSSHSYISISCATIFQLHLFDCASISVEIPSQIVNVGSIINIIFTHP